MPTERVVVLGFIAALAASCTSSVVDSRSDAGSATSASSASGSSSSGGDALPKEPFTVAEGLLDPESIVADETAIYWGNRGTNVNNEYPDHDGSIVKLAHAGGSQIVLVSGARVDALAADSGYVYWIDDDTIRRVPKAGGEPGIVAVDTDTPHMLTVDATGVYWTTRAGSIVKAPAQGGPATTLLPPSDTFNFRKIAVDSTNVYCADYGDVTASIPTGGLWRIAKSGGPIMGILADDAKPWAMAVDDQWMYWSTLGSAPAPSNDPLGAVFKMAKSGGIPILLADGQRSVYELALAGGSLFWGNYPSGPVLKVGGKSGASTILAPDETVTSVAIGPDFVYWVVPYADGGGMIRAVAR